MHNGFHEDGLQSALDVARAMVERPDEALAAGMSAARLEHIRGEIRSMAGRAGCRGGGKRPFRYGIDYDAARLPRRRSTLPGRSGAKRRGLVSLPRHATTAARPERAVVRPGVREVLEAHQIGHLAHRIELLAQPKVLGHIFNPVSFWLIRDENEALRAVIAEVSNTFGDPHS